jgi:dienelactone hydrolase
MTEVLMFHHVQGLTPGVVAFADDMRAAGHVVHTPDLFEGRRFETITEGINHAQGIGFSEVLERGTRAADDLPSGLVYAGFSLGVMSAQKLVQTRPGARGALFFEACLPVEEFGEWPTGVPVQIHGMDADPFFADEGDVDAARVLVDLATPNAELFVYPGDRHLFTDRSLPSFDDAAASLLMQRVLAFLADLDGGSL